MNLPVFQLLVLAGIALFLLLRLRSILGTREGYERPLEAQNRQSPSLEVIEGGQDRDVTDNVEADSPAAIALTAMKQDDAEFSVTEFVQGARAAYEMILMDFENGDLASIKPLLSAEIYDAFAEAVSAREAQGFVVEAEFIGLADVAIEEAEYDRASNEAEITMRFVGELTYLLRDKAGDVVEGNGTTPKRQKDIWTFSRIMGSDDPNWILVATGD